jgi:hypothetical protein
MMFFLHYTRETLEVIKYLFLFIVDRMDCWFYLTWRVQPWFIEVIINVKLMKY